MIDASVHVRPIVLWQFLCGGIELPLRDYEHIATCLACETFGDEVVDALGRLETELHNRMAAPVSPTVSK
jgi:hypothetical protein